MIYDYSGNRIDNLYTHTVPREQIFTHPIGSDVIFLESAKDGIVYQIEYGYEENCTICINGQPRNMSEYRYLSHGVSDVDDDPSDVTMTVGGEEIVDISSTMPERKCCICGLGSDAGYVASPFATMKDGTSGFIHVHMACADAFGVPKLVDEDVMGLIEMSGGVK